MKPRMPARGRCSPTSPGERISLRALPEGRYFLLTSIYPLGFSGSAVVRLLYLTLWLSHHGADPSLSERPVI